MKTISYAITVCNEIKEIKELIDFLKTHIRDEDEIVIQYDSQSATKEVIEYVNYIRVTNNLGGSKFNLNVISFPLNNHFGNFKNNLKDNCTKDYIFQIDADEIPHHQFMKDLPSVLDSNDEIDVYLVPRVNTVQGLTKEHIEKWRWNVNSKNWVNWPDYQWRIWKNKPEIKWINKVHERLDGFNLYADLPPLEEWSLYHHKEIERQEKQNEYYANI